MFILPPKTYPLKYAASVCDVTPQALATEHRKYGTLAGVKVKLPKTRRGSAIKIPASDMRKIELAVRF